MILVFSSEPTKVTYVSDRVTRALFEWIEHSEAKSGELVFPDVLIGLNHQGLEVVLKCSKRLKISQKTQTIVYKNGDKYVGEIVGGLPHGKGTSTYANGDKYVGGW